MIKLIASDVDGTLLDDDGKMHPRTRKAIQKAEDMGIQFMVCSGRSSFEVSMLFEECGFTGEAICLNGADLRDLDGTSLCKHFIEDKYIDLMEEIARKKGYIVEFHCPNRTYMTTSKENLFQAFYRSESKKHQWSEEEARVSFNNFWFYEDKNYNVSLDKVKSKGVVKIEFIYIPSEEYDEMFETMKQYDLNVTSYFAFSNIELNDRKATKGLMLQDYCRLKGIAMNEVVVMGDGLNDVSMFELFEHSVAMENAENEIKAKAKYIVSNNNECGAAEVIEGVITHCLKEAEQ